jgi:hypothetical protein
MKCDFGIPCRKMLRKLKFHENWHIERHTLFWGINEFPHFLLFCLIWVKYGTVNIHENILSDVRFLQLTLVKAHFTQGHK